MKQSQKNKFSKTLMSIIIYKALSPALTNLTLSITHDGVRKPVPSPSTHR